MGIGFATLASSGLLALVVVFALLPAVAPGHRQRTNKQQGHMVCEHGERAHIGPLTVALSFMCSVVVSGLHRVAMEGRCG